MYDFIGPVDQWRWRNSFCRKIRTKRHGVIPRKLWILKT